MPHPLRAAACALAVCALAGVRALAAAAPPPLPAPHSPALWATIDVCNTAAHPDTIGIRGSMPGTGDGAEAMFMRFRVEYLRNRVWTNIGAAGESPFEPLGNAAARTRQAGADFTIALGGRRHYLLRGVVTFQWRLGSAAVATTLRSTTSGHSAAAGADPPGYSAGVCSIVANRRGSLVITPVAPRRARRRIVRALSTVHG